MRVIVPMDIIDIEPLESRIAPCDFVPFGPNEYPGPIE